MEQMRNLLSFSFSPYVGLWWLIAHDCNLYSFTNFLWPSDNLLLICADKEEKDQCNKMHSIIKEYKLDGEFRWLVAQKDPVRNGEIYRFIAGASFLCMH